VVSKGVQPQRGQHRRGVPDRGAIRRRHRLHLVPAVPLARAAARRGRAQGRFAAASGGLLVILAIAAHGIHSTFDLSSGSTESAVYGNVLLKGFPAGTTQPTEVLMRSDTGRPPPAAALAAYRDRLAAVPGVAHVTPPRLAENGTVADYQVILTAPGQSDAAMAIVRGPLQAAADTAPPGSTALIGGITSVYVGLQHAMNRDYAVVFPVATVLTLLILALLLRSAVAPST
jgi:RND superfamily putative drug exporter